MLLVNLGSTLYLCCTSVRICVNKTIWESDHRVIESLSKLTTLTCDSCTFLSLIPSPEAKLTADLLIDSFTKGSHDPDSRLHCKVLIDTCGVGSVTEYNLPRREKMPRAPVVMVGKEDEQLRESAQGTRPGRGQHTLQLQSCLCALTRNRTGVSSNWVLTRFEIAYKVMGCKFTI